MADLQATPATRRQNVVPTNTITYKGRSILARIDAEAKISYIVEIMSTSFNTKEHHITLCLRDENDVLVTQSNLARKVKDNDILKLVPSPATEALAVVTSLKQAAHRARASLSDSDVALPEQNVIPLKLALFNLSKYVREQDFTVEFMMRGGTKLLVKLVERTEGGLIGNSLAYALQGVRGILEFESSWEDVSDPFVDRCLSLLVTASQPNILRPATAIVRKLVISSSHLDQSAKTPLRKSRQRDKGKGKEKEGTLTSAQPEGRQYGFDRVFARLGDKKGDVLKVVLRRLEGAGDLELAAQSLGLINACLRSAQQENSGFYPELAVLIEVLNVRRYVSRLMPTCVNNIVEPQILNFQERYTAILQHRRQQPVRPSQHPEQEKMLSDIWRAGRLGSEQGTLERLSEGDGATERTWSGWKRIGLTAEEEGSGDREESFLLEVELFRDVGELGLECLHWFAMHEEHFHNRIIEQEARAPDRRCPIGRASSECVKILCEHYKISAGGHHAPSAFQVFLLNFPRIHSLVLRFFIRMWSESESRLSDFGRLASLVRSQTRLSLTDEASKTWLHLEKDFLEADYRTIRDRQMEQLEKEDGMLSRTSVRELKDKLSKEAYDVLAEQRVGCMLQGSWFNAGHVIVPGIISHVKANPARPLCFLRLSPNRRTIAWNEFAHRTATSPTYESLRERVDIANLTDVRLQTGCAIGSRSPNLVSKLSFSLMSGHELSLLDLDAVHAAQLAEWTDGIRALRGESGMAAQETRNYVHILTELALKVRLLDITGDGVDIPEKVTFGPAPRSVDFWFAK